MQRNYGCFEKRCFAVFFVEQIMLTTFTSMMIGCCTLCGAGEDDPRWVHPLCQQLPIDRNGPFVELADRSLMTVDTPGVSISEDDGKT